MPIEFHIDTERKIVFSRAYATLSERELEIHRQNVMKHEDFDPGFNQLSNLSEVSRLDVSKDFIYRFARLKYFNGQSKRALVAPSDIVFGSARAYQAWHEGLPSEIAVFRYEAEAREWLNLT